MISLLWWVTAATAQAAGVFLDVAQARALMDQGATVVDARGTHLWSEGHLPGARVLDWRDLRDGILRTGRLTDDTSAIEAACEAAGVTDGVTVLVYDEGAQGWGEAGRILWMLEYLGHEDVHILNGGWPAWTAAGETIDTTASATMPGHFTPRQTPSRRARLIEVEAHVARCARAANCGTVIWDTRTAEEFNGATPHHEHRGGHIPGARHLSVQDLRTSDGRLLPPDRLRDRLIAAGIEPDKLVIPHCTGGLRSGFAYAVLRELDYPRVRHFDGSMWEWTEDPDRPLETE